MTSIFLPFFKIGILFDEFLLTIAGEADRELGLIARAFPAQNQAPAIFRVANVGTRKNVSAGSADVPVRIERGARTSWCGSGTTRRRWTACRPRGRPTVPILTAGAAIPTHFRGPFAEELLDRFNAVISLTRKFCARAARAQ